MTLQKNVWSSFNILSFTIVRSMFYVNAINCLKTDKPCCKPQLIFLSKDILFDTWLLTWLEHKLIWNVFEFSSDCIVFASLLWFVLLLTQPFSWTKKFRGPDGCKTSLDDKSLRQYRKKGYQLTVQLVSLNVCMCKCQALQYDPQTWFLTTKTEWQLLKLFFFPSVGYQRWRAKNRA